MQFHHESMRHRRMYKKCNSSRQMATELQCQRRLSEWYHIGMYHRSDAHTPRFVLHITNNHECSYFINFFEFSRYGVCNVERSSTRRRSVYGFLPSPHVFFVWNIKTYFYGNFCYYLLNDCKSKYNTMNT